jgi:flagellar basal body-associated protein FliL
MLEARENQPPEPPRSSPLIRNIVTVGLMILVPAILALATFRFIVMPILSDAPASPASGDVFDPIPAAHVTVDFDEDQATVLMSDPDAASPLLLYQISMAVDNENTRLLIEQRKSWFQAMLSKLHRNRTRAELNNPHIQENLLEQARQEANILLRKLDPANERKVLEVMYLSFRILDL